MKPLEKLNDTVTALPRGGCLVDTPEGYIQFGSPPETIKDTMKLPEGTPLIFVLPTDFFNWIKGISVAELEFPIYYNFFIRQKKTLIICKKQQAARLKKVLKESLFGPEKLDFTNDFQLNGEEIPDIKAEMDFFKTMEFDDVVEFGFFKNNSYTHGDVKIKLDEDEHFEVYEKNELLASIPGSIVYKAKYLIGERVTEPYEPPLFGITCLGPSSGFDPYENTSGFIIWLNHQGIMVDPPVNSTEWLLDSNVSPKFIDSIILTHCHADHDAGTFQKILEEGKITIYSTETVMMSFLRKYAALTDVTVDYLMGLFNFHPIKVGKPLYINDGQFDLFYSLHSIPTFGFRLEFQDYSVTYSSDHNGDPKLHKQLFDEGIISQKRYDEFSSFPWDSTVVFHESGVPPLHTPIAYLNTLPKDIQEKTVVYHIPAASFPDKTDLTLARFGIEHTMYFDVEAPPFEEAYQLLSILKHIDFLSHMKVGKVQEFITIGRYRQYKRGEHIIRAGTHGDTFFIIARGNVTVKSSEGNYRKILGACDYFGEGALLREEVRSADVIAETDVTVYAITKDRFKHFLEGTEYDEVLRSLAENRNREAWETLSDSPFISFMTETQRTYLESMLNPYEQKKKGFLIKEGEVAENIYIIRKGNVVIKKGEEVITVLSRGDLVGSVTNLHRNEASEYSFSNQDPVSCYRIDGEAFRAFLSNNPGLIMKLKYQF